LTNITQRNIYDLCYQIYVKLARGNVMSDMDLLIETFNRLSNRLDQMAANEKNYSYDLCMMLENLSWETLRTADCLKNVKDNLGV